MSQIEVPFFCLKPTLSKGEKRAPHFETYPYIGFPQVDPSTITSFSGTLGQPNLTELVEILMGMILWGLTYVRQHVYRFVLAQAHPNEHGLENSCPSQKHVEALVLFQIPLGTAPFPSSAFPRPHLIQAAMRC